VGLETGLYCLSEDFSHLVPFKEFNGAFSGDQNIQVHRLANLGDDKLWLVVHKENSEPEIEHGYLTIKNGKWEWTSEPFSIINQTKNGLAYDIRKNSFGETWIATNTAVFVFNEQQWIRLNKKFKVEIDHIFLNNKLILHNPEKSEEIGDIKYAQNSINFTFHANSLIGFKEMRFRYKLENYTDDWSEWSELNFADFKKLHEGTYNLLIQGKNSYGIESEILKYNFTILPPWYRTWIAYIVYFISVIILLYLIIQLSLKRVKNQNLKLEEIVKERTSEIAEQNQQLESQKSEIILKTQDIVDSIIYAKRIQDTILPYEEKLDEIFNEHFVFYRPKDIVSGDFYWARKKGDLAIFSAIDCTGHGVPGALVSIVGNSSLLRCINEHKLVEPAQILDKHRDIVVRSFSSKLHNEVKDGMDMSLCTLDSKTNILKFSGANNSCIIVRNKEIIELKGDKQPIGFYSHAFPFTQQEIQLFENDCVYQYTDGYVDQFGGQKGKKLKSKPFKEYLIEISHLSMPEQFKKIETFFETWKSDFDQVDDVCVFAIKI
jgi:serine phosphatase RsbU (regulator of sigma subunit)